MDIKIDYSKCEIRHCFAWYPVFIRIRFAGMMLGKWVWLKKYTRVLHWSPTLNRYRTTDTFLGHISIDEYTRGDIKQ